MFGFCKDISLQLYSQLGNLVLVLCFFLLQNTVLGNKYFPISPYTKLP